MAIEAVKHLGSLAKKNEKEKWERAYGLSHDPAGMFADEEAAMLLPPSASCNDVMHGYFCNGVVSAEIALAMDVATSCGLHLKSLLQLAESSGWRRPTDRNAARGLKFLFSEKCSGSPFTRARAGRHGKLSFCIIITLKCWSVLGWMKCDDPSGAWQPAAERSVR